VAVAVRRHPGPTWEIPLAAFIHVAGFVVVIVVQMIRPEQQVFKEPEAITVEMVGSSAKKGPVIQSAMRTPDPVKGAPTAPAPEAPINPNQLTMDSPDAPQKKGAADDKSRQEALDALRRENALRDLDAPIGNVDREATAPDGGDAIGSSSGGIRDPELAAWVKAAETALNKNFHPLPAYCKANPKLQAIGRARVLADGTITGDPRIKTSSGNASIDDACLRAFVQTPKLPPTPAKFADGLGAELTCKCPT
jgi:hypothetical protein